MAAGTHVLTAHRGAFPNAIGEVESTWVGDTTNGTVPTLVVTFPYDCELESLATTISASATADYDITAVDANGLDRLRSCGLNRHTTAAEEVPIVFASTSIHPIVRGGEALTITLANNSDTSSGGKIIIRYRAIPKV